MHVPYMSTKMYSLNAIAGILYEMLPISMIDLL